MADYDWFDHDYTPTEAENTAAYWRPYGFLAVFKESRYGRSKTDIEYYQCRRGCGCLVWKPEDHIKNVCREFNPIAGQ